MERWSGGELNGGKDGGKDGDLRVSFREVSQQLCDAALFDEDETQPLGRAQLIQLEAHTRSAVQCLTRSTAQHSTAQHNTAQHSTAQHSTAHHTKSQHSTPQHSTAQHTTAQHNTAQHTTDVNTPSAQCIHAGKCCSVK